MYCTRIHPPAQHTKPCRSHRTSPQSQFFLCLWLRTDVRIHLPLRVPALPLFTPVFSGLQRCEVEVRRGSFSLVVLARFAGAVAPVVVKSATMLVDKACNDAACVHARSYAGVCACAFASRRARAFLVCSAAVRRLFGGWGWVRVCV